MAQTGLKKKWQALQQRYGVTRMNSFAIVLLIGFSSLAIRLLFSYELEKSALLYVGLPYFLALFLIGIRPPHSRQLWWHQFRDHALSALIVFLASSIVLFEGFVCVLFFLPIYFFCIAVIFFLHGLAEIRKKRRGSTFVSVLPLLLLASSFEGTTDWLSFERDNQVVVSKMVEMPADRIMQNIATPFSLQKERGWLISIFPMPWVIEAGSLAAGDIHHVHTRYKRWFITNTHEGEMALQIVDVTPSTVKTRILKDTTYFSSYVETLGTEITLTPIATGETEIRLRIDYRRKLDPAWYFHPLQKAAMKQMASFLIDEVMIREQ